MGPSWTNNKSCFLEFCDLLNVPVVFQWICDVRWGSHQERKETINRGLTIHSQQSAAFFETNLLASGFQYGWKGSNFWRSQRSCWEAAVEDRASPQGAQQDVLVKMSTLLMLSHAETCVLTARPKHLLHSRRLHHTFRWNKSFSSGIMGCFMRPLLLCSLSLWAKHQGQIFSSAVVPTPGKWMEEGQRWRSSGMKIQKVVVVVIIKRDVCWHQTYMWGGPQSSSHPSVVYLPAGCAADSSGPSAREEMAEGAMQVHEDGDWYHSREAAPAQLNQQVAMVQRNWPHLH